MDDFLAAILAFLFEVFGEAILQLLCELLAGLLLRGFRHASSAIFESASTADFESDRPRRITLSLILGIVLGLVSVAVHGSPIFHPGKIHGISLLVSPLLTGLVMAGVGAMLRRRNREPIPWESFWGGFAFALGMAAIRFIGTR